MRINLKAATLFNIDIDNFNIDLLNDYRLKYTDPKSEKSTQGIEYISLDGQEKSHVSSSGYSLFHFVVANKQVPSSYLKQKVKERAKEIEVQQGYKVGRIQMREISSYILEELIARAMFTRKTIPVIVCHERQILIIGASSQSAADSVLSFLIKNNVIGSVTAPSQKGTTLFQFNKMDIGLFWLQLALYPLLEDSEDFNIGKSGAIQTQPATESSGRISFKNINKDLIELNKELSHAIESLSIEHKSKSFTLSNKGVFSKFSLGDSKVIKSMEDSFVDMGVEDALKAELVIVGMEILDSVDAINKLLVEDE